MSNKYSQNVLHSTDKSTTDAIKTTLKKAIQKPVKTAGDLIGNIIADGITSILKSPQNASNELH